MPNLDQTNLNIQTINGIADTSNPLTSITINNSIQIPKSASSTNNAADNTNAGILIKDVNSTDQGHFYNLNVNSLHTTVPSLYFNNDLLISSTNLYSELEYILVNEHRVLETSNIIVHNGYINFQNSMSNVAVQGSNGVGIRYSSNNTVQFKNYNTGWIDLVDIVFHDQFKELVDVDVHTNPLINNQYITYNATSNLFVNSNLAIVNDFSPSLGGDLNVGNNSLQFGSNQAIFVDNIKNNNLLVLKDHTTIIGGYQYIEIGNSGGLFPFEIPSIIAKNSSSTDSSLAITASGIGNINLNAEQGIIYAESDSLQIRGFVKNSIFRTSNIVGGYNPETTYIMPLNSDTILFDFSNNSVEGTYYANVGAGIDGQKLNLIFSNTGSNVITLLADFVSLGGNGVITGTGYTNGLNFLTGGQCSSLIYLGESINAWQILNTGSYVF
uniref:Uncharacterized protein n=1 Tax=viral metagenome TaxID=1070528 RepID=A0A6C0EYS5_9ZZZZ